MEVQSLCAELGRTLPPKLWPGMERRLWAGAHLVVPPPDVQDVPLGDRPVEGQAWHSITKGERVLAVGDSSDVDRHLWGNTRPVTSRVPLPGAPLESLGTAHLPLHCPGRLCLLCATGTVSTLPSPETGVAPVRKV